MKNFLLESARHAVGFALNALVWPILWGWFCVPLGAPALRWPQIFGLVLVYRALTVSVAELSHTDTRDTVTRWLHTTLFPPLALLFGYIYTQFL